MDIGLYCHQDRVPTTFTSNQPAGADIIGGRNSRQRSPDPMAKASEAHVPDPKPEKHADGDDDGRRPPGHGPEGKATHNAVSAAATARTQAIDRAANAPLPCPNDAASKIRRRDAGRPARTVASTPRAQPATTVDDGES